MEAAAAPRGDGERRTADARRGALELARATLAAQHGLTAGHSDEVGLLCEELADELGITGWGRSNVLAAAQLHDIGKVAVPDEILDKPGSLDEEEWALVHQHTRVGERIVMAVPELDEVARIVRHSHEHWDGSGYPDGLAGEDIPLASRVVLCVDAFHALRSDRPYRRGRSAKDAIAEISAHSGTQFDPAVVAALEGAADRVRRDGGGRFGPTGSLLRSRRVAALLIALVVGGSAFAAIRPDLGFDGDHTADASTDVRPCGLDSCPVLEFPSLRPLADRAGARATASVAFVGGHTSEKSPSAPWDGTARDGLRLAGMIEHRPGARARRRRSGAGHGGGAYAPQGRPAGPALQQAPATTHPPSAARPPAPPAPAAHLKRPKRAKRPKAPRQQAPPSPPPGLVRRPPPPRGQAYGYYRHEGYYTGGDQHRAGSEVEQGQG